MNTPYGARAVCPFYIGSNPRRITCEWFGCAEIRTYFHTARRAQRHLDNRCCERYEKCPLAAAQIHAYLHKKGGFSGNKGDAPP